MIVKVTVWGTHVVEIMELVTYVLLDTGVMHAIKSASLRNAYNAGKKMDIASNAVECPGASSVIRHATTHALQDAMFWMELAANVCQVTLVCTAKRGARPQTVPSATEAMPASVKNVYKDTLEPTAQKSATLTDA